MAVSVFRPLAVRLQLTMRLQSRLLVQSYQNGSKLSTRNVTGSKIIFSTDAVSPAAPEEVDSDSQSTTNFGSRLFVELRSLGSLDEVLAAASERELSGNEASIAISALRHLHRNSPSLGEDIVADTRFTKLSKTITSSVKHLSNESLISSLSNTFHLNAEDDEFIHSLEGECRRRLRLMPVRYLGVVVSNDLLLSRRAETKALVNEAARVLELRWREIENPQLVRRLLPSAARVSQALLERIEDKTLELLDQYSFREMTGLTKSLANTATRSLPILRAVSYQVLEQQAQWEITPMLDMMSAMGTVGFHNPSLFSTFATRIQQQITEYPLNALCDVIKTYAILRFQATDLLDSVHRVVASSLNDLSTLDLKRLLFAYSQLNYEPSSPTAFYEKIGSDFSARFGEYTAKDQIDITHSLALLQHVPENVLEQILESQKDTQISNGEARPLSNTCKLKLLQINSYAQLELPDYKGPTLTPDLKTFPSGYVRYPSTIHKSVVKVLQASLGDDFNIELNVAMDVGYIIDAEISSTTEGNGQKLAVITLGPPCYLYSTRQLIGRYQMMLRHLELAGHQVLEIPYHDWYHLHSPAQQISYLKEKLATIFN